MIKDRPTGKSNAIEHFADRKRRALSALECINLIIKLPARCAGGGGAAEPVGVSLIVDR